MDMKLVTTARRTFDRALAALPITQHDRVWVLYLVSGPSPRSDLLGTGGAQPDSCAALAASVCRAAAASSRHAACIIICTDRHVCC